MIDNTGHPPEDGILCKSCEDTGVVDRSQVSGDDSTAWESCPNCSRGREHMAFTAAGGRTFAEELGRLSVEKMEAQKAEEAERDSS